MLTRSTAILFTTLSLFGFSILAYASQDVEVVRPAGYVDWSTVAMAMGSIILTLVGGIVIHVNSQITKLSDQLWKRMVEAEQQIESLHKTLLREYHTKEDLREMLNIMLRPVVEKLTILTSDMDAVYRELLRSNKRRGDSNDNFEEGDR